MDHGVTVSLEAWQIGLGLVLIGAATAAAFFKGINDLSTKFTVELDKINRTIRSVSESLIRVEEQKVGWSDLRDHCAEKMANCPCGIRCEELERRITVAETK